MTQTDFLTRLAGVKSLGTSVEVELALRVRKAPEMRRAAGRDNAWLAEEFVLIADLVEAKGLVQACNNESDLNQIELAEDFARGALRDCGVTR